MTAMEREIAATRAAFNRILVVEDDVSVRETLETALREEGFDVVARADGREALEYLRSGAEADLIVLDLMMPVMDGWEFRAQQRAQPELADVPVLAISASSSPTAAAVHADGFLRKPFRLDALIDEIHRILGRGQPDEKDGPSATERPTWMRGFAATLGHELNNPLTAVLANLSFAQQTLRRLDQDLRTFETRAPELAAELSRQLREVRESLDDAQGGGDRLLALSRSLRQLGRPKSEDAEQSNAAAQARADALAETRS